MGLFKKEKSYINKEGYKKVYKPEHPKASERGFVSEHLIVAEKKMKRPLGSDEVVHHKDGDKFNNRRRNLEVLTRSEHYKKHNQ